MYQTISESDLSLWDNYIGNETRLFIVSHLSHLASSVRHYVLEI